MADFKQLSYLSIKGLKIRSHTSRKDRLSTIWPLKKDKTKKGLHKFTQKTKDTNHT